MTEIRILPGLLLVALLSAAPVLKAHAAERPLWELALGGGVVSLPYYRGAESNRVLPVPVVYPVYRGDFLKVDEEGVRGLFFQSERVKLDVSLDGTVPGSDDDVEGREGMPALDPKGRQKKSPRSTRMRGGPSSSSSGCHGARA